MPNNQPKESSGLKGKTLSKIITQKSVERVKHCTRKWCQKLFAFFRKASSAFGRMCHIDLSIKVTINCLWNKWWNFYTVQFYLWEEGPQPIYTSLLWMSISQFQTWNRSRPLGCFRKENEKDVTKCVIQFFQIKQPPFLDSEYRQDFHQSLVCVETLKCRFN